MPITPLPPRRCARNALTAVRLIKPPCVMLLIQTQVENLVGLLFAQRVTAFHQPGRTTNDDPDLLDLSFSELECEKFHSRLVAIGRFADDSDEFVEIFQRNQITLQGFSALFS